jgi:hypothetical protein
MEEASRNLRRLDVTGRTSITALYGEIAAALAQRLIAGLAAVGQSPRYGIARRPDSQGLRVHRTGTAQRGIDRVSFMDAMPPHERVFHSLLGFHCRVAGRITLRYKDYRPDSQQKTMTLKVEEFIRRFQLYVLPDGFQRICYYGFLGNRHRQEKLARCRQQSGMPACAPPATEATRDYLDRYEELTGSLLREWPVCHPGRMVRTAILLPAPHAKRRSRTRHDTRCRSHDRIATNRSGPSTP